MIKKKYTENNILPLYEVKELTMEEALLALAAEKELLLQKAHNAGYGYMGNTCIAAGNRDSVAA
ncbi:MAG: hypothetical protein FHK82_15060 [Sedimenticola thiotaurini]|uniref:Uncharacterized protein n=1 Tax=Sedimenticola thiotaurini TaxID=1543721 RepID=A0A558CSK6_9GAMM|nr:MAG: hypothetical protein FHK82_15060 [Sedimenticola thiotaurini]